MNDKFLIYLCLLQSLLICLDKFLSMYYLCVCRSGRRIAKLFPSEDPNNDRIVDQLMYVPPDYNEESSSLKKILVYNGLATWSPARAGRNIFLDSKCPVNKCSLTANKEEAKDADAILFKDQFSLPPHSRSMNQV